MDAIDLEAAGRTHFRTIFLSDIHLGTRGCQAERLLSFLEAHTCDNLYLVGDIICIGRIRTPTSCDSFSRWSNTGPG